MAIAAQHQCTLEKTANCLIEDAPVSHKLCEMFWTIGPAYARWAESRLRREGLSPQRIRLMAFLRKNGASKMRLLRNELGVTATSVTALVDSLEKEGMVTRQPDPADRRATLVALTPVAEQQLKNMCGPFKDQVAEIFAGFSDAEQEAFLALLARMRAALVARDVLKETPSQS